MTSVVDVNTIQITSIFMVNPVYNTGEVTFLIVDFAVNKSMLNFLFCVNDNPVGIYLLKVDIRNTRTRCEICSELTIKTPERR